jgi:hypothetical protein
MAAEISSGRSELYCESTKLVEAGFLQRRVRQPTAAAAAQLGQVLNTLGPCVMTGQGGLHPQFHWRGLNAYFYDDMVMAFDVETTEHRRLVADGRIVY